MRSLRIIAVSTLLCGVVCAASADDLPLVPLPMDYDNASPVLVNHSHYLNAPAGKDGFIRVQGEHLRYPNGARFRIWGVNMAGPSCFPDKEGAIKIANDLARLGINCVRFHGLDSNWGHSVIDYSRDDTQQMNTQDLDRWDFLVAELKRRGIYTNINLNVFRKFKNGDGVRDPQLLGLGKGATYFNQRLVDLQKDYARKLLTHRNAYTGNEYRHEPAVLCIEMVNENSVIEAWLNWRLEGKDDDHPSTWSPLPVSYAEELTQLYNQWLQQNYKPDQLAQLRTEAGVGSEQAVPRLKPSEFSRASKLRFHSEASYYLGLEKRFFREMNSLLHDELKVKPLLIGTADHNDGICGYPHISANLEFDLIDGHGYWQHPQIGEVTKIRNTPMVEDPMDSTVVQFARTPVVGKPYTISETNHPFPHEYACEGIPILTAYSLLHDWDGIYWFTYDRGPLYNPQDGIHRNGWFDLSVDPVKMTNIAACTAMWYEHDVQAAKRRIVRSYSQEQIMERLRADRGKEKPFFSPGFSRATPLVHATRFDLEGNPWIPPELDELWPPERAGRTWMRSDTGELAWDYSPSPDSHKRAIVTLDTPRSCALIGFVQNEPPNATHLSAHVENEFCTLLLTSLDDQPIRSASRLLLATTAKCANTGMTWKEDGQTLDLWGTGPTVVEPVRGTLTLHGLEKVQSLRVTALSPTGKRLERSVVVTHREPQNASQQHDVSQDGGSQDGGSQDGGSQDGVWVIRLADEGVTWYLIEVDRDK